MAKCFRRLEFESRLRREFSGSSHTTDNQREQNQRGEGLLFYLRLAGVCHLSLMCWHRQCVLELNVSEWKRQVFCMVIEAVCYDLQTEDGLLHIS